MSSFSVSASPEVIVREINLTTSIQQITTGDGAQAGVFHWGPIGEGSYVASENDIRLQYGKPTNFNGETWFNLASFVAYGTRAFVSRAARVTGNTVAKTYVGNSTTLATTSGNNYLRVANTSGIVNGMVLFYSNNSALNVGDGSSIDTVPITVTSVVNSTFVTLSSKASANSEAISVIFRDDSTYTAVGQETVNWNIDWDSQSALNKDDFVSKFGLYDLSNQYIARFPGAGGNSLRVAQCDSADQFTSTIDLVPNNQISSSNTGAVTTVGSNTIVFTVTPANTVDSVSVTAANTVAHTAKSDLSLGDYLQVGNTSIGTQFLKITDVSDVSVTGNVYSFTVTTDDVYKRSTPVSLTSINRYWEFYKYVGKAPGMSSTQLNSGNSSVNDELHVVVVDDDGFFTDNPGSVLEVYKSVSRATNAKTFDGLTNFYRDVINQGSRYVYSVNDRVGAPSNTAQLLTSVTTTAPLDVKFFGGSSGQDESNISIGYLANAADIFGDANSLDIRLIMTGKARGSVIDDNAQWANYLIDNIAEMRKDCVVFTSPNLNDVRNNRGFEAASIVEFRSNLRNSSYGFLDSGYKIMYDRYNDVERYVPLNGDMAGLAARTAVSNDPWWSFAGTNRGIIKNVEKLAWDPGKKDRDTLYTHDINPVCKVAGVGPMLYGDKTLMGIPNAFDRINVRMLFIYLEKAIANYSRTILFDFNDDFTRAQWKSKVVPYLTNVQSRRGLIEFLVLDDSTVNDATVIDANAFVGYIFIKPAHSINWVTLNFVPTPTGTSFSEVVGRV